MVRHTQAGWQCFALLKKDMKRRASFDYPSAVQKRPPSFPPSFGDVFELRVVLRDIEPAVWRRVRVPADAPLGVVHDVLQIALGWTNSHLHDFQIGTIRFGMADIEDEIFCVDEDGAPLGAVALQGSTFVYRYDFGDDWEHELTVERVLSGEDDTIITCTGGERACPPEDCGGPHGYANLLVVLANPNDEDHADMKRWVGRGFNSEKFDLVAVNKKLAALSKRVGLRKK